MDLRMTGKVFFLLLVVTLAGYGFSIIGVPSSPPVDSFWKLFALVLAISLVAGWVSPHVRGIRKEDQMVAILKREVMHNNQLHTHVDNFIVTALEAGRAGQKIRVKLWNGKRGEGVIIGYAGTLSPATIRLTESEM
ncbi:MAG: hypothetical protein ABIG96_06740 [Candidatus Micrarchaeota archaeon]